MNQYVIKEDKTGHFVRQHQSGRLSLVKGVGNWHPPTTFDLATVLLIIQHYRYMEWVGYVSGGHDNLFAKGNLARLALRPIKIPSSKIISFADLR